MDTLITIASVALVLSIVAYVGYKVLKRKAPDVASKIDAKINDLKK